MSNNIWKRKPSDNPKWKELKLEDLFLCYKCKSWYPWFKYCKGCVIALGRGTIDNVYEYLNDDMDRGGRKWACDLCIDNFLYLNNLITITDFEGKLIEFK